MVRHAGYLVELYPSTKLGDSHDSFRNDTQYLIDTTKEASMR